MEAFSINVEDQNKRKMVQNVKYPKCVPACKSGKTYDRGTKTESAVSRKRAVKHKVLVVNQQMLKLLQKENKLWVGGFMARRMGMR